MPFFKQKPSPALIVSILALLVALVGTAVAAPIEISLNRAEKREIRKLSGKIAAKVSDRQITARAPGLSVANAQSANSAGSAQSAVDAERLGGLDAGKYQRRVTGSCTAFEQVQSIDANGGVACGRSVALVGGKANLYRFFVNLDDATAGTFNMGQVQFEDLGVPGQFRVCFTVGAAVPWVTYLNGVRASGATSCTSTQTVPDALSDFEGTMRRTRWFSAQSGDSTTVRSFSVYAISEL